ncbi:ribonucleoprotein [Chryseobacterium indologenes]|uniref:TROVE domain-containing protein n=1 Tax=Chryseobacterium indologenes TaxID=253 RepID=UPI000BFD395C|nr:TROVE domain-containing protein [Chryseobacterium indologenes]ATN04066.1 ribonucleoprotein [Chryseobacterium indologenes]AYY83270.1 TROVE domain-containing protein [Chryseobacterium indologenes]QIX80177.1 TROVE domain-containing protein [Chryseobacterium indologenes]UDQ53825.1 TROVE domain-containing protein [Chryseobacterium indologenes]
MKFNFLRKENKVVLNYEGAKAYTITPAEELYTAVVTTGLSDTAYEKGNDRLERIRSLIKKNDPEFVAKLAVYARKDMYLRSIPLVLTTELAKQVSGTDLVSRTVDGVVQRADEITELLAYYQLANKRTETKKLNKLSKQIQKGLMKSFNKFDEYQFAKYNRKAEVTLRDALFLVHPKAKDESQQIIFNKIVNDMLETPYTWEVELSTLGQKKFVTDTERKSAFKNKWEELIFSNKLGYMATLRNLRNILEAGVSSDAMNKVCRYLSDEKAVSHSKQLPFRFLAAYRELKTVDSPYVSSILEALDEAVIVSAGNIRGFGFETSVVIAADVSGSMQKPVSKKSKVLLYDIGLLMSMMLQSQCKNVVTGIFGDRWLRVPMPKSGILRNVDAFYKREGEVGYSTNGYLVLEDLIKREEKADKIMLFTDTQLWDSSGNRNSFENLWNRYKAIAPHAKLYIFDLGGYGRQPLDIRKNDVYLIAGWSDKIFEVLNTLEDRKSAVQMIQKVVL